MTRHSPYSRPPPRKIHVSAAFTEIDGINHRLKLLYDISWLIMSSQSEEKTKRRRRGGTYRQTPKDHHRALDPNSLSRCSS